MLAALLTFPVLQQVPALDRPYLGASAPAGQEVANGGAYPGHKMWIPDGLTRVRGVIAVCNHETGAAMFSSGEFRSLAKRLGFAMFYYSNGLTLDATAATWSNMAQTGALMGHPELQYAPVFSTGLSYGGYSAECFAARYPYRVMGALPIAGAYGVLGTQIVSGMGSTPVGPNGGWIMPVLWVNQGNDSFYPGVDLQGIVLGGRANGARWGVSSPLTDILTSMPVRSTTTCCGSKRWRACAFRRTGPPISNRLSTSCLRTAAGSVISPGTTRAGVRR